MNALVEKANRLADTVEHKTAKPVLTTLARFTFAATLLLYFWGSAQTKLGDGLLGVFRPALGAYAQIFPRMFEAVGYDASQLAPWQHAVVVAGTWAEALLPALLVLGLLTRLAAAGMIGFVIVQTATDLVGHGALGDPATLGAWFDAQHDAPILDLRLTWLVILTIPALMGGGPLSVDAWISRRRDGRVQAVSG